MTMTASRVNVADLIASFQKRLDRIESSGKSMVKKTSIASVSTTIPNGGEVTITTTSSWNNPNISDNPKGDLYWELYFDNDNEASYQWPQGSALTLAQVKDVYLRQWRALGELSIDDSKSYWKTHILNNSGASIDIFFYTQVVYLAGQSASAGV